MFQFTAYLIQCITNLHAGSGDANYGIIDKLVQRDPVTDFPTIHASSLKGALREHFEVKWGRENNRVKQIFGKEVKDGTESQAGNYRFQSAELTALPVRCTHNQYVLTFDSTVIDAINQKSQMLIGKPIYKNSPDFRFNHIFTSEPSQDVYAEDYRLGVKPYVRPLAVTVNAYNGLDHQYASMKNHDFKEVVRKLPVIARNNLEDGTSKNLWYEEVVPHQSIFITYIGRLKQEESDFDTTLISDIIQIGANATVGYGLCKFYRIS